jgi:ribonuclease PH
MSDLQKRHDGRNFDQLRDIEIEVDFQRNPEASVLISCGNTRVICAVSVMKQVPRWMKEQGKIGGWVTAEYQMLPSSTSERGMREAARGKLSGRTQEIQRLIGRSLRAVMDLEKLPPYTFQIDCDVIDADGGTRCASLTGACVALEIACNRLRAKGELTGEVFRQRLAAVSVGRVAGELVLDLDYVEDSEAEVDMNVVMSDDDRFIEVQGTAEDKPFSRQELDEMLALVAKGVAEIFELQQAAVTAATATVAS